MSPSPNSRERLLARSRRISIKAFPRRRHYRGVVVNVVSFAVLALVLFTFNATAQAQSFSAPNTYTTGDNPQGAAVGDFNGDGYADLAVANTLTSNISVFMNKGDGTFQPGVTFPTDVWPAGIAAGDLNKDGKMDLVIGNSKGGSLSTGSISVLLGNGDGTFQLPVNYDAVNAFPVKIADLNNDTKLDIVVGSISGKVVYVMLGNGNGTFQAPVPYGVGIQAVYLTVADFNGDSKPDLAVAGGSDNAISIMLGNGDGTFTLKTTFAGNSPLGIDASDLNGDGKQDLVNIASNSGVSVWLGNGDGTFQSSGFYPTGNEPHDLALADFSGDGKKDVVVVNTGGTTFSVLRGNGDGTFQSAINAPHRNNTIAVVSADLNNDGKPDLITVNNAFDLVDVRLNSPSPKTVAINTFAGTPGRVLTATFLDYNTSKTACNYTATIDWGDGTGASSGRVTANGGGSFNVTGIHTYAGAGIYLVTTQIADDAGNFASVTSTATVAPANGKLLGITAGSVQSTPVNNAFSTQLQATYSESGVPVSGVLVTFSAPVCGASGTFASSGTATESVITDGGGVATASMFTANSTGGTYAVEATTPGGSPAGNFTLTNTKLDQTISFGSLSARTFGDPDFTVSASATSGLAVSFGASGNCTVSGNTVHITGAGSCTITASQSGDATYNAAADAPQSFAIAKANQTITFGALSNKTFGDADFNVSATASSGLAVSFAASSQCTISGNTVHITAAGSCTITASQAGNSNYDPAPDVPRSFTIAKASQTITFGALGNKTFGDADFNVSATASSGLAVSFGASGQCTTSGNTVHITAAGSCTITASQAGNSNYDPAPDVPRSFTIAKASQTITFGALGNKTFGDADFNVSATASSGLAVSFGASAQCTVSGNTVHITGAGSCTVTASQAGDSNYNAATSIPQSFSIAKAASSTAVTSSVNPSDFGQVVNFTATVTSIAGTPTGTVQFKDNGANLGTPVTVNGSGTASFGNSALAVGTHTITADYSGSGNFIASSGTLSGGQVVKPQPTLSINDVSMLEGSSGLNTMIFTVTLSAASSLNVTASFATGNGTAATPSDYAATSGTVSFNPGVTTRTIGVNINGDTSFEPDETFTVNLSNPINATFSKPQGIGTIKNDDAQGGFISFSQSNYSVTESGGFVTITVNRTNDTSRAATVDYATDDTGAPATCGAGNNLASSRCDFTKAAGTLSFAAGETQKTFAVLISRDTYIETAEMFTVNLFNSTGGAILATPLSSTVTITDDNTNLPPNAIDDPNMFVRMHYHDFLNREADQSGLDFWTGQMTNCGTSDLTVCRVNVSGAFFLSIEFQQTGYLVERMYKSAYGDAAGTSTTGGSHQLPVPVVRFNEFLQDTQRIGRGVVVLAPGWEQALENNKQAYAGEFVSTSRFVSAFPTTMTPAQFVDKLNGNAGNVLSSSERTTAINLFSGAGNSSNTTARAQALRQVAEDSDLFTAEFNRAFVLTEFFGYLRRNPNDLPDSDYTGYEFWLSKLNQFNGDYIGAEMVKAFIASSEYRQRFGP